MRFTNQNEQKLYGRQRRNQLYGPNYTDFDLDVSKGFRMPGTENAKLKVGVQLFNAFNHANFQIPVAEVNSSANWNHLHDGKHSDHDPGCFPRG